MSAEGEPQNNRDGDSTEDTEVNELAQNQPTNTIPEDDTVVHWTASEYIVREKNFTWYILLAVIALGFIAIDLFIVHSWTFSALVIVMTIAIIVYSNRPPRMVQYTLSGDRGLYVGEKLYGLHDFKSFGLIQEDDTLSVMLMPVKRFSPGVSVYFPQEVGEKIVDILGARLPMEKLKLDVIDQLVRRLHL